MSIVLIVGPHKSGTSLVRALLDGHPQLAVVPFETHFAAAFGIPVSYLLKRSRGTVPTDDAIFEHLKTNLTGYLRGQRVTADTSLNSLKEERVLTNLASVVGEVGRPVTLEGFLGAAYQAVANEDLDGRVLVEKSVENAELAPYLLGSGQVSKVIQVWRDPEAVIPSIRRAQHQDRLLPTWKRYALPHRTASAIAFAHDCMERTRRFFPGSVLDVQFEDLTTNLDFQVRRIADFLELTDDACLRVPSSLGRPWASNSSSANRPLGAVDAERGRVGSQECTPLERFVISTVRGRRPEPDVTLRNAVLSRSEGPPLQYAVDRLSLATVLAIYGRS